MFMKHYAPTDVNQALKLLWKWGSDSWGAGWLVARLGGRGWCGVNAKKNVVSPGLIGGGGGQGGCEPRIELILKMQKNNRDGGRGGGVRVVVNQVGLNIFIYLNIVQYLQLQHL